jgi:DNA-binding transcriptional LysR family regulator
MDSRYLKSLIAVIDCGSIAEAARNEHRTAAALSQRIKSLEDDFGFELLSRSGRSATPTEACLSILPRARRIVNEVRLLAGDVDTNGLTGTLRLGIVPSQITPLFISTLRILSNQQPGMRISLTQNNSLNLYNSLISGEIDCAIVVEPEFEIQKSVKSILLCKEPLVLLSPKQGIRDIESTLRNQPYIEFRCDASVDNPAKKYLEDHALDIKSWCDSSSLHAIAMMVLDGVGVSLIPRWFGLEHCYKECGVTPVESDVYSRNVVLLTSKETERPEMFEKLLETLSV